MSFTWLCCQISALVTHWRLSNIESIEKTDSNDQYKAGGEQYAKPYQKGAMSQKPGEFVRTVECKLN